MGWWYELMMEGGGVGGDTLGPAGREGWWDGLVLGGSESSVSVGDWDCVLTKECEGEGVRGTLGVPLVRPGGDLWPLSLRMKLPSLLSLM